MESLCAVQAASVTKLETEKRNVIMQAESHSLRAKKDLSELEEERSRLDSENTRLEAQVRQLHSFINSKKVQRRCDIPLNVIGRVLVVVILKVASLKDMKTEKVN